jgi:hypothetical protein
MANVKKMFAWKRGGKRYLQTIAIFDSKKLHEIEKSQTSYAFIMHSLDEKFTDVKDLREKLGV